jgi:tripartite-type tricarboxylate transporter receptor subunit TctC
VSISRRGLLHSTLGAALLPFVPQIATAQAYPTRSVRVIVPTAPGGQDDVFARLLSQRLSVRFGTQFYVENVPGGSNNIGIGRAARAAPDGYTMLIVNSINYVTNPTLFNDAPYDPKKDFTPVTLAALTTQVLSVHPSLPVQTVKELVTLIKANRGKYSYASPGFGSAGSMTGELFRTSLGLDMVQVPFNGAGPAIGSTVAGHTLIAFSSPAASVPQITAGRLRGLAVATQTRLTALPNVPTMAEAGFPGIECNVWETVLVPAGTPPDIVTLLNREIARIIDLPDVGTRLAEFGYTPFKSTTEEAAAILAPETEKWARVVQTAGIKPE